MDADARLYLCCQRRRRQLGGNATSSSARGEVFNVGTGDRISLLDLVASLNTIFSTNVEPDFQPVRAGDVRDSLASLDRIRQVLGYQPTISFEEGLRHTVQASVPTLVR